MNLTLLIRKTASIGPLRDGLRHGGERGPSVAKIPTKDPNPSKSQADSGDTDTFVLTSNLNNFKLSAYVVLESTR